MNRRMSFYATVALAALAFGGLAAVSSARRHTGTLRMSSLR
jgi:hypothetical protein